MNIAKRLTLTIAALLFAFGIGYGTYSLAGPADSSQRGSAHEGHDHGDHADEEENHAGERADAHDEHAGHDDHADQGGQEDHAGHDDHAGHGEDHDEDLEDLFGGGETAAGLPENPAGEKDAHAGYDHGSTASARQDSHEGHDHQHGEGEICPEHRVPEAEDALCRGDHLVDLRPGEGMKVRLQSRQAAERAGIAASSPVPAEEGAVVWPGQVVFNRDRQASLSALAAGTVRKVHARLGEKVEAGAVLAEIASPEASGLRAEAAAAQSRVELARSAYLREKDLLEKGITSRQEFQQAEAEWRQAQSGAARARQQLQDFGLDLAGAGSTLPVRAPFAGTVVERTAVAGEAVSAGAPLFTVADLSALWIEVSVPEEALVQLRPGLTVNALFPALPGRAFPGKIFWVAPALDQKTRMLKALAEVENRDGLLRSGLFGQVQPVTAAAGSLAVAADALQTIDGNPFLFVLLEEDLYELRRVTAGRRSNGLVFIPEGVRADDRVVTTQAFALKSEVLKARLGASCADH